MREKQAKSGWREMSCSGGGIDSPRSRDLFFLCHVTNGAVGSHSTLNAVGRGFAPNTLNAVGQGANGGQSPLWGANGGQSPPVPKCRRLSDMPKCRRRGYGGRAPRKLKCFWTRRWDVVSSKEYKSITIEWPRQ